MLPFPFIVVTHLLLGGLKVHRVCLIPSSIRSMHFIDSQINTIQCLYFVSVVHFGLEWLVAYNVCIVCLHFHCLLCV